MSKLNAIKERGMSGLCKKLYTTFRNNKTPNNMQQHIVNKIVEYYIMYYIQYVFRYKPFQTTPVSANLFTTLTGFKF